MQDELDIQSDLHEIDIDLCNEDQLILPVSCSFETTFDELHYLICQKVHLHPRSAYRFYIPKLRLTLRSIPRSKDSRSDRELLSLLDIGDDFYYQNRNQRLRLKMRGIGEQIEKIHIERDMRRAYAALQNTVLRSTRLKRNRIQRENLTLLYDLANDLLQHQVQRLLSDQTSLIFNLKGNHLMAYCLITQTRDQIEYFFFPDQMSYIRYALVRQDAYLSGIHKEKYKDGTAVVFSKKQLKETELTKPYNSQMYVEHSCYVYFYDVKRGYEVDVVNNTQAKEFMRYLVALQKALIKLKTFRMDFNGRNAALYIGYNPHTKATLLQQGPKIPLRVAQREYDNVDNIVILQQYPRSIDTYELDYLMNEKQPLQQKDERYRYIVEAVCSGKNGRSKRLEPYESQDQIDQLLVDVLLDVIEKDGLPQKVIVREQCVYAAINSFCKQLGIEIAVYARLPKTDAYYQANKKQTA